MKQQLEQIKQEAISALENAHLMSEIEDFRIAFLGKKGKLTSVLRGMGALSPEERPVIGQMANEIREFIEKNVEERKGAILKEEKSRKLREEIIDVTLPGKRKNSANLHPLAKVSRDLENIFLGMGFSIVEGPDVEYDHYCFEALNMPKDHPARDTQDTFYITENILLRTQTSSVQIRTMENQKPPIRIISPGRVYRSDTVDATHSPLFHQLEGLVIDKGITMSDLVGTLETFVKSLYGDDIKIRFRPHHFPYTEPSAEVDMSCFACGQKGCPICKGEGWIEILGCGMVHEKVLEDAGIDPKVYSGFAFGIGLERVAMMKYDIDDMRLLYENDVRFLKQF